MLGREVEGLSWQGIEMVGRERVYLSRVLKKTHHEEKARVNDNLDDHADERAGLVESAEVGQELQPAMPWDGQV